MSQSSFTETMMNILRRTLGLATFLIGVFFLAWSGYHDVMQKQINPAGIVTTLLMAACFIYVGIMSLRKKRVVNDRA
ncbi:MAG: hypothetical protein QM703_18855 [Gemmatales bacterium]